MRFFPFLARLSLFQRVCALIGLMALLAVIVTLRSPLYSTTSRDRMYPDVLTHASELSRIMITAQGRSFTIEKQEEHWVLPHAKGAPANTMMIRDLLSALSALTIIENKGADTSLFSKFGLRDPAEKDSPAIRVTLHVAKEKDPILDLMIGSPRIMGTGKSDTEFYARRAGEEVIFVLKDSFVVERNPDRWKDVSVAKP